MLSECWRSLLSPLIIQLTTSLAHWAWAVTMAPGYGMRSWKAHPCHGKAGPLEGDSDHVWKGKEQGVRERAGGILSN